jgi:5-carboxymethyl-2-hydroxymuconate isomerase
MPQITLQYSENCRHAGSFKPLFRSIHAVLERSGGILIDNCKSRAQLCNEFYIADGDSAHAFAHLEIRFIEGRTDQVRDAIGRACLALLLEFFKSSVESNRMQITVEIDDIKRQNYFKHPPGTLTPQ